MYLQKDYSNLSKESTTTTAIVHFWSKFFNFQAAIIGLKTHFLAVGSKKIAIDYLMELGHY